MKMMIIIITIIIGGGLIIHQGVHEGVEALGGGPADGRLA